MSYVRYEIGLVLVYNLQNEIHVENCFQLVRRRRQRRHYIALFAYCSEI